MMLRLVAIFCSGVGILLTTGCAEPIPPGMNVARAEFQEYANKIHAKLKTIIPARGLKMVNFKAYCEMQPKESRVDRYPLIGKIEFQYQGQGMIDDTLNNFVAIYEYQTSRARWMYRRLSIKRNLKVPMEDQEEMFAAIMNLKTK